MAPTHARDSGETRPCTVGLTGGLATGKSTVAGLLAAKGVPVFEADATVHDLYGPNRAGAAAVAVLFGNEVLDAKGGVDRAVLSERVLKDPDARHSLEGAIHPLVRGELRKWLSAIGDRRIAVVEAALLIETGSFRDYDVLMVVWCDRHQQLQRAQARGVPVERLRGLIAAQLPMSEKMGLADVLVDNRGDLDDLPHEIDRAWSQVHRRCAERAADRRAGVF
jgi:dephospho-CoA kinase